MQERHVRPPAQPPPRGEQPAPETQLFRRHPQHLIEPAGFMERLPPHRPAARRRQRRQRARVLRSVRSPSRAADGTQPRVRRKRRLGRGERPRPRRRVVVEEQQQPARRRRDGLVPAGAGVRVAPLDDPHPKPPLPPGEAADHRRRRVGGAVVRDDDLQRRSRRERGGPSCSCKPGKPGKPGKSGKPYESDAQIRRAVARRDDDRPGHRPPTVPAASGSAGFKSRRGRRACRSGSRWPRGSVPGRPREPSRRR